MASSIDYILGLLALLLQQELYLKLLLRPQLLQIRLLKGYTRKDTQRL